MLRYDSSVKQFTQLQHTLMQQQANQSSREISLQINHIRNQMAAISLDHSWLSDLSKFSQLVTIQESMRDRLKLYFPTMYAYSIASDTGDHLGGDVDLFIGDVCEADIKHVASMFDPDVAYFEYQPYLHSKADAYHFDVMMPIFAHGKKLVFFMSFKADILSRILKEHLISQHYSFLVRKDIPDLIEVSPQGVRNTLKRDIKLNVNELDNIAATSAVPHTRWNVVVVENKSVIEGFKKDNFTETAVTFVVLFLFWSTVLWFGLHTQSRQTRLFSKLSYESHHDVLTGLPNRRKLIKELNYALDDVRHLKCCSAILYMDLNGFKEINDEYGHDFGDALLKAFSHRLSELTRQQDLVARMGGDEFVVLLNNLGCSKETAEVALSEAVIRFKKCLHEPYLIDEVNLLCNPSIGSILIDGEHSAEAMLTLADKKMYQEKALMAKHT